MFRISTVATISCLAAIASCTVVRAENNVVVILDDSGSMDTRMANGQRRIDAAKQALKNVLERLPVETQVGVLALNSQLDDSPWIVPMGVINATPWQQRIDQISAAGGTPLGQFTKIAADELLKLRTNDRYGTYRLLVVTDGEATDRELLQRFVPDVLARGIVLNVIGVDMASEHSLATSAHTYRPAADAQSLVEAISEVFAESTTTGQDAQGDFDLLAGLPDGFAEEAIKALSEVRNEPIEGVTNAADPASGTPNGDPFAPASQNTNHSTFGSILGSLICCCGSVMGLVLLAAILIRAFSNGKRRR